jgi:hypothetical protein
MILYLNLNGPKSNRSQAKHWKWNMICGSNLGTKSVEDYMYVKGKQQLCIGSIFISVDKLNSVLVVVVVYWFYE